MQLAVEELEPIVTATETAQATPYLIPHESDRNEQESRKARRLDRVAKLCAARIQLIERSLFRIGWAVNRLARHYDRERGLTALAAKITKEGGKVVSRQFLSQALRVFKTFTKEESENRFSLLTNTHLLKAAQAFPEAEERSVRNRLLDRAVKEKSSVAELATVIKNHKAATASAELPETAPPTVEVLVDEPHGYVCGNGLPELKALTARDVSFLRVRETVASVDAIIEAGRVLTPNGLMVVDLAGLGSFPDASEAANKTDRLRILHTLIVFNSSIRRNAPHSLPITDRFRIAVLIGGYGFRHSRSQPERFDNPMSDAIAEELIYSLIPAKGLVVDLGTGSVQTATWAKSKDREFLAVEPNKEVHAQSITDLEANPPTEVLSTPSPSESADSWPMVSDSQRERGLIDGKAWDDLTCCERTQLAVVVSVSNAMTCPECGKRCTAKPGARLC